MENTIRTIYNLIHFYDRENGADCEVKTYMTEADAQNEMKKAYTKILESFGVDIEKAQERIEKIKDGSIAYPLRIDEMYSEDKGVCGYISIEPMAICEASENSIYFEIVIHGYWDTYRWEIQPVMIDISY